MHSAGVTAVDGSRRELHGALLDAELLLDVFLAMTGGQGALTLESDAACAELGSCCPPCRTTELAAAGAAGHRRGDSPLTSGCSKPWTG
jgi:DNA polymerase III epsilon subunit-like protein